MVRYVVLVLALLLTACTLAVPEVTPTVAPTRTPSPTPEETTIAQVPTRTPISTPTHTATVTPSATPTATITISATPTSSSTPSKTVTPSMTPTPTATATGTVTPSATPTITPSVTLTATPSMTVTPSTTPTPTNTLTPTATNTGTATPSATFTTTPTVTPSATPTATFTPTITPIPTDTPPPSPTPLPIVIPTETVTPSVTPTVTPTWSATPTITLIPSPTPFPTIDMTQAYEHFNATLTAFVTVQAALPTPTNTISAERIAELLATRTAIVGPTLAVTPTFITATPGGEDLGIVNTTIPSSATPAPDAPGPTTTFIPATPTLAPTVAIRVQIPATLAAPPILQPFVPPANPNVQAFALSTIGGLNVGGIAFADGAAFIAYNPVYPDSYARADDFGILRFAPPGGREGVYTFAPYHEGFSAPSAEENKNRVVEAVWSPNGDMLAFRINSGFETNDGVWFWQPAQELSTDPSYHILRDCPSGCNLSAGSNANQWQSRKMEWSRDNISILITLDLPAEGRQGFVVRYAWRDEQTTQSRQGPQVIRYDYGYWTNDGQRIVVSGRAPDGQVVFGLINPDGGNPQLVSAGAIGLGWVQDAVQRPNGQIVMLASPNGRGGPLRLTADNGTALTGFIGDEPPTEVKWSCDRSAVYVVANGRRYIARTDGNVTDVSGSMGLTQAVNWVCGNLPANAQPVQTAAEPAPVIPSGVVAGSQYQPGQQLRIYVTALNVRSQPTTTENNVVLGLTFGEYVAILAGPAQAEGLTWWQVQTANGTIGWIAGEINGSATIGP